MVHEKRSRGMAACAMAMVTNLVIELSPEEARLLAEYATTWADSNEFFGTEEGSEAMNRHEEVEKELRNRLVYDGEEYGA